MSLFLDLEDTLYNSAPNGDLVDDFTLWTPIEENIEFIQDTFLICNDAVIFSYAVEDMLEASLAYDAFAEDIRKWFPPIEVVRIIPVHLLCDIWRNLFCLHLTSSEYCLHFTKEMAINTIFLRKPNLFRDPVNFFFDDSVSRYDISISDKQLKVYQVCSNKLKSNTQ